MRRAGLMGALGLVVLINGIVLAGVAWNRAGEPEATLVLTERELPMAWGVFGSHENTGIALSLNQAWAAPSDWFDEVKLRELGFEPERYVAPDKAGADWHKQPLPRRAYVVMEFDGPAWAALLQKKEQEVRDMPAQIEAGKRTQQQLEYEQHELERMRNASSRLVAVDVGNDPEALRARYADTHRYLITAAEVRMGYSYSRGSDGRAEKPMMQGYIGEILTGTIHVPARFHAVLNEAIGRVRANASTAYRPDAPTPRYQVTLHYGKRYEPWVVSIEPLEKPVPLATRQ